MHIKMIATDLDGTLLRADKSISGYAADVFRCLRKSGIIVVFATGRPEMAIVEFAKIIMPHGIISNNGAGVSINGSTIFEQCMEPVSVKTIVSGLRELGDIKLILNYGDYSLTNHDDYQIWGSWGPVHHCDFTDYNTADVLKIAIEAQDVSLLSNIDFAALGCWWHGNVGEPWYMVMANGVSKLAAIKIAAAHFNIDVSEVAAFGDDENDIEMLRGCGIGVAMENAIDEAKAAADYICGSNENDGVAKWLEAHILSDLDGGIAGRAVCTSK